MRRIAVLLVVLSGVTLVWARPAAAGPGWFHTTEPSYEPGDSVTLVAHDGWYEEELDSGPFHAWLLGNAFQGSDNAPDPLYRHYVGTITITATGEGGSFATRLSITFDLPSDLEAGVYGFNFCNATCDGQYGSLVGGEIHVGVPNLHHSLHWPSWEPEIAKLGPGTKIAYGGEMVDPAVPQAAGWPTEIELEVVGPAADPDASPPDTSEMWWDLDEEDLAELTATTSTTSTTTTAPPSTTSTTTTADELAAPAAVTPPTNGDSGSATTAVAIAIVSVATAGTARLALRSWRRRGDASSV